ncbi:50S ribosome-binding GTPase (macronuclear) [Tetrahymena thermophila SB210]|uniref:50S ribosome-binding GTPase n=1 Tax=Tetrahymena thermophila (strain SB210) TaxID=312017 RepID=W7XBL8_TETTS|nr:50S ribosome-binding GTPase [Tetrahymena thermophila SB210]EWS74742.1 50S ribosome-binding GTPase [Tetrahymena thermophila SB210]|eukprot:XP_012652743.1 50S ribosome-binding GTPase [Tetrahymena thermophila SB210]
MNKSEIVNREQNLDIKKLLELFKQCQQEQSQLKDKDIILLAGPTGSGKSTTANYLLGSEMFIENIETCKVVEGQTYKIQTQVFNSNGKFSIGYSKQSETSTLQKACLQENYFLCDSPGFFDNRGAEIEIANAQSLNQFMQNCKSMKMIILVSYHELVAQRGQLFEDVFKLVHRILQKPEKEQFEKIIFLFTKFPQDKNVDAITKEILEFHDNVIKKENNYQSQIMKSFLNVILQQLNNNKEIIIVNPIDRNHQLLCQKIISHKSFSNPAEEFCFSVSESAKQKLQLYVEETKYIVKSQQQGNLYGNHVKNG